MNDTAITTFPVEAMQQIKYWKQQTQMFRHKWQRARQYKKLIFVPASKPVKKATVNDLYFYVIKSDEPLAFYGAEKHEFTRHLLVTRRPYADEFSFGETNLYFDDIQTSLNGQAASAWFIILDWIKADYPIIMSVFTEKDLQEYIDVTVDANMVKTIKERALIRVYSKASNWLKRFDLEIEELKDWNDMQEEARDLLTQKIQNEVAQNTLPEDLEGKDPTQVKIKRWVIYLLSAGWLAAIGLLFVALNFWSKYKVASAALATLGG